MNTTRRVTWGPVGAWAEARTLMAAGAVHVATVVHVGRRLDDLPPAPPYRMLPAADSFLRHLGDALSVCPNRYLETRDPVLFLDGRGDAYLVENGDGPIGVILPKVDGRSGRLRFFGLLADARGRGLGAGLHAFALAFLRDRGAEVYLDTTDANNVPMLRIFAKNRCRPLAIEHQLR